MTTDLIRLRAEFLNTQVITRNTGKRLGVVKELLVDIDRREVVALGLRDNLLSLSGMPKYMYRTSIRQSGDVILVEDEDVIEDIDIDAYSPLIHSEVITEAGEPLGKVRDFQFNLEDGIVSSLIIDSLGMPQVPDQIISTYELPVEEIVSSGPNRIIVFEGSEDRITQLTVGILERLGIGRPPWEREEEGYYAPTTPADKQLGTGIPVRTPVSKPVETRAPAVEGNWDEDDWEQTRTTPPPRQQAESIRYEEYEEGELEEDNWGDVRTERPVVRYEASAYEPKSRSKDYEYDYDDVHNDVWDDDVEPEPYNPPRVNIPEKKKEKAPEYEEEAG
ncbi:MAG: PRC-barrel domain-containing protein [Xenococcaceae cyanobacterium]